MDTLTIKSNFARDRVIVLGSGTLVLAFNQEGLATMPKHLLPVLQKEMRVRPGRYTVVTPELPPKLESPVEKRLARDMANATEALLAKLQSKESRTVQEPTVNVEVPVPMEQASEKVNLEPTQTSNGDVLTPPTPLTEKRTLKEGFKPVVSRKKTKTVKKPTKKTKASKKENT